MGVSDVKNGNGSGEGEVTISQNWKISTNAGKINRIKGFISVFFHQTGNLYQACFGKIYTNSWVKAKPSRVRYGLQAGFVAGDGYSSVLAKDIPVIRSVLA